MLERNKKNFMYSKHCNCVKKILRMALTHNFPKPVRDTNTALILQLISYWSTQKINNRNFFEKPHGNLCNGMRLGKSWEIWKKIIHKIFIYTELYFVIKKIRQWKSTHVSTGQSRPTHIHAHPHILYITHIMSYICMHNFLHNHID